MDHYTADTVSLLAYLVDALPPAADHLYQRAEAGDAVLELPAIATAEAAYKVEKGVTVRGITVSADAEDIIDGLGSYFPVVVSPDDHEVVRHLPEYLDDFPSQIHDALVVANHAANDTASIVTSDERIAEHAPTVWG